MIGENLVTLDLDAYHKSLPCLWYSTGNSKLFQETFEPEKRVLGVMGAYKPDPSTLSFLSRCIKLRKPDMLVTILYQGIGVEVLRFALHNHIPTICIIPGPIRCIYPVKYRILTTELVKKQNGLLISAVSNQAHRGQLSQTEYIGFTALSNILLLPQLPFNSYLIPLAVNAHNHGIKVYTRDMEVTGNRYLLKNKLAYKAMRIKD